VSDSVRSMNTKAIAIGLMMLINPVKPNRMSDTRLEIMIVVLNVFSVGLIAPRNETIVARHDGQTV
jgi:hypothetical protein